jgi:hypothetical protein
MVIEVSIVGTLNTGDFDATRSKRCLKLPHDRICLTLGNWTQNPRAHIPTIAWV